MALSSAGTKRGHLQRTLSFNAFAAEKVCRLRDVFLNAGATRRR